MAESTKSNLYHNGILKPTAQVQFEENLNMQFKYKSYDMYIEDNYNRNKAKWHGRVGVAAQEVSLDNGVEREEFHERSVEIINDEAQINEVNDILESRQPITAHTGNGDSSAIDGEVGLKETEVKYLKSKRKKVNNNARRVNTNCPYCLSVLVYDEFGILQCSGDKLQIWEDEFKKYEKMDEPKRAVYVKRYTDLGIFLELYDRWAYVDEKGKKQELTCIYSNKLFNPISRYRTTMADPCLVSTIERSLGRRLTEEEIYGEVELYREGKRYFTDYRKGRIKVKIPLLVYPDNML